MKRFIKNILIVFLASATIFNSSAFAYDDVHHTSPYFYAVEYLRRNDVFKNTKLFKPDTIISRAEFIKYLVLLNSPSFKPEQNVKLPFNDTRNTAWYAPYLYEAIDLGIINRNNDMIYPEKKITVMEAVELLFHSKSIPIPTKHVGHIPFKDVDANKDYQAMMMRAYSLGIVFPEKQDYFGIYKRLSRVLAAHMIYKMDLIDFRDPQSSGNSMTFDPSLKKIIDSWDIINSNYVDRENINASELSDNAVKAMVETLKDPYSVYMDGNANKALNDEIGGKFEGIGAYVAVDDKGRITVVAPIKDSPAQKAGIKAGDIILKVDDFIAEDASLYDVVNRIKGPKGTSVKLFIQRDSAKMTITVVRGMITVSSLEYDVVGNGNIMHIRLVNFNENAIQDFRDVAEIILNNPKIKGVIIDMRDNPGGLLDVAIHILNHLLHKDTVAAIIQYNYFNLSQLVKSDGDLKDYPMVALVNKGSASASEIVAGALQDNKAAKIIGETTFGKGTVQEINYFNDSSSIKLTIAKWLTPNGSSIEGNGITPDIEVKQGLAETTDIQLNRAIQELNKSMK